MDIEKAKKYLSKKEVKSLITSKYVLFRKCQQECQNHNYDKEIKNFITLTEKLEKQKAEDKYKKIAIAISIINIIMLVVCLI